MKIWAGVQVWNLDMTHKKTTPAYQSDQCYEEFVEDPQAFSDRHWRGRRIPGWGGYAEGRTLPKVAIILRPVSS